MQKQPIYVSVRLSEDEWQKLNQLYLRYIHGGSIVAGNRYRMTHNKSEEFRAFLECLNNINSP